MTTPVNFNSPERVIVTAMKNAGLLGKGQAPSSEQFADNMNRLSDMINFEQTQGIKLWLQTDLNIPLVLAQATYTISPTGNIVMAKPTRVIDAYYSDSSSNRRPLIPLARADYIRLSNVTNTGAINSYFVDKQASVLNVSFWLAPDATAILGTAHLIIQQQATQLVSLTDTMVFPQEWFMWLCWGLADEICGGQPQAIMDRCKERATAYRTALEDWDVEDAPTMFTPDTRSYQNVGNFK